MPGAKVFIDTNILLYFHDSLSGTKRERSRYWLVNLAVGGRYCVNLQVLNELSYVLLRKKWFASPQAVFAIVDDFAFLGSSAINDAQMLKARQIHTQTSYSWWDCLLLAAAMELQCTHFLSEDLQDGRRIEGLTIVDPFAHSPDQILVSR